MRRDENRRTRDWLVSGRRGATLTEDLEIFLQEIARGRGFIAIIDDVMPERGCLTAEEFAVSLLLAATLIYAGYKVASGARAARTSASAGA